MKRVFTVFLTTILIAILAISLVGCAPEEGEALAIAKDLIYRSIELNEIFFCKKGIAYKETGNSNDIYMPVLETEKYILKSKLVEATRSVFSYSYADSIISMAFNGVQSEINQNSVQSRFMVMGEDDMLYVNKNYEYVVENCTEYDYDTIKITYISGSFIEATIKGVRTSEKDGELVKETVTVEVTIINESDGWRLNSATY